MRFARPRVAACFLMLLSILGAGCDKDTTFPVRTYPMGDRVALGHFVYIVYDTEWRTHLGEGPSARIPESRFFLIRFSSLNNGAAETMLPTMSIEDDAGHVYTELSNGDQVPQWVGFVRPVTPGTSVQGIVVFDVPPAHYKLRIQDDTQQRTAMIDIPLTFSREAPPELNTAPTP